MNGELRFEGIRYPIDAGRQRFFGLALILSIALHVAGFLTSPYWQSPPASPEDFVQVDMADIPAREMPRIPDLPAPRLPRREVGAEFEKAPADPKPPPTRETIREKVAGRGVLKALSSAKRGDPDPLPGIGIPKEIRVTSRGSVPAGYNTSPAGIEEPSAAGGAPGIVKQVASASRSSRALSSQVFRTDSGLEGEISGDIDDESRASGAISSAVARYRSGIRYAYNKELLKNPSLSGRIVVAFVILPDGSVRSAEIRQSSVNWPPLEEAVLKRLSHWKFPKSRGEAVRVTFPFVFHPEM